MMCLGRTASNGIAEVLERGSADDEVEQIGGKRQGGSVTFPKIDLDTDGLAGGVLAHVDNHRPAARAQHAMHLSHRAQLILALEVVVQSSLGDRGGGCNLIHARTRITLPAEEHVGGVKYALTGADC